MLTYLITLGIGCVLGILLLYFIDKHSQCKVGSGLASTTYVPLSKKIDSIKEAVQRFERYHPKLFCTVRVILAVLLGLFILINLGLYFKDSLANVVGIGITKTKNLGVLVGSLGTLVAVISFVLNLIKGTFSVTKFVGGFNIFSGQVQGKLIYYGILLLIAGAVAFGIYTKMTQATYRTDYKNQIKAETVNIDQRPILPEVRYLLRVEILGLDIHFWRTTTRPIVTINNDTTEAKTTVVQAGITEKPKPVLTPNKKGKK